MKGIRPIIEGLIAMIVAVPAGACGHYVIAQQRQYGRIVGYHGDTEGASHVMAFSLFAVPALLLSIAAVRGILAARDLTLLQKVGIGAAAGAAACSSLFMLYSPVVFPGGPGFIWPLPLIMGTVGGAATALIRRESQGDESSAR